jgi:hypothetical protein
VGPFGVVVAEIALQVELEAGLLGDQIAGKRRFQHSEVVPVPVEVEVAVPA